MYGERPFEPEPFPSEPTPRTARIEQIIERLVSKPVLPKET